MNAFEELKQEIEAAKAKIFDPILEAVSEAEGDAEKFYDKGNKSAGSRLRSTAQSVRKQIHHPTIRKIMSEVEQKAQNVRQNVQDIKNNS